MRLPTLAQARVMVTGGRGFVGRYLLSELYSEGAQGFSCARAGPADFAVDVTRFPSVLDAVSTVAPDAIIHLAGITYLPEVDRDPVAAAQVNVLGTLNVLEAAARAAPTARVLVVSSCTVFGDPSPADLPLREDSPRRPTHAYGHQKLTAELLAERAQSRGQDVIIARPFNHIGVGQDRRISVQHFARELVRLMASGEEPVLRVGNLAPRRDFLDVRDVVSAYLRLLQVENADSAYNVASGSARSVQSLLEVLIQRSGLAPRIERDPARSRGNDPEELRGDSHRLRMQTGWEPRIAIDTTLSEIFANALAEAGVSIRGSR